MDSTAPITPETAPAAIKATGEGRNRCPSALMTTAAIIITPRAFPKMSAATATVAHAPMKEPGTPPTPAQAIALGAMCLHSRRVINTVTQRIAHNSGPGTSRGSNKSKIGAATMAMPNPSDPCTTAPSATAASVNRVTEISMAMHTVVQTQRSQPMLVRHLSSDSLVGAE